MLDHANGDGSSSHRGAAGLAVDCNMHIETVKKAVRWLKDNGYVIETYSGWRYGGASVYRFPPRPEGSPMASLTREAENGETAGNQGSPQASPPEEDQLPTPSLGVSGDQSKVEDRPVGECAELGNGSLRSRLTNHQDDAELVRATDAVPRDFAPTDFGEPVVVLTADVVRRYLSLFPAKD
jgi:hypothetical protein